MNNKITVNFNNTSVHLSQSMARKMISTSDKKSAIKMSFANKIKYIFTNKEKKLSDLYDFISNNRNGEKLSILENGEINKGLTSLFNKETQKSHSAIKIQRYFHQHIDKLIENGIQKEKLTKIIYNGDNKKLSGRAYFISEKHKPVYKPDEPCHNENEAGSFKHVSHKDQNFVALKPNNPRIKFNTENNFDDLAGLSTIKYGLAVASNMIIARNAGECVFDYIDKAGPIPASAFKNAAHDLYKLHTRGSYLRDIKPGNMAYDDKHKQINFIDVEDRLGVHNNTQYPKTIFKVYGKKVIYTPKYITQGLLNKIYIQNSHKIELIQKNTSQYLKAADEYAFIMTMIQATTTKKSLKSIFNKPKIDFLGNMILNKIKNEIEKCWDKKEESALIKKFYKIKEEYNNPGIMNLRNKNNFTLWIKKNIKPEYTESVKSLLTNPAEYAKKTPKIHLADMLLFK